MPHSHLDIQEERSAREPVELAFRLTLITLLLQPIGPWWLRWGILLLAAAGLLSRRALTHPALWLALAVLTGVRVIADWPLSDNHAYLLSYWCLACGLAGVSDDPSRDLARNARWLIGLTFAWALMWKLAPSGGYGSGLFFRVTMLTDPRFEDFAQIAGGLSREQFEALRTFVTSHADGGLPMEIAAPVEPRRFTMLAELSAWWNLMINGGLAIAFLAPRTPVLPCYRDVLLLIYCIVTYAVATVAGFGWLLLAMAASQTAPSDRCTRLAYLASFGLIVLYREIPWADAVIAPLIGG